MICAEDLWHAGIAMPNNSKFTGILDESVQALHLYCCKQCDSLRTARAGHEIDGAMQQGKKDQQAVSRHTK